ncbi:MAG: response regulator [Roseobacter sp.]
MESRTLDHILLVDDDKVTNLLHQRQIRRRQLARHVDVVTDGQAALEFLQECADSNVALPELILLDINMPRMNGFEFLESYAALPNKPDQIPTIVMVSTSTLRKDKARAVRSPLVANYVTKPLRDIDLERIVSAC